MTIMIKDSVGGSVGFSYPVFDYTRFFLNYTYDLIGHQKYR